MRVLIGLVLVFGLTASGFGEVRTWTSKTGQTLEAEYARNTMDTVWLKAPTGKQKKIPISGLSQADQDYIFLQTPPTLEISVDDNRKSEAPGRNNSNKRENFQFEVKICKTSKRPYPSKLTVDLFVLGWDISQDEYELLETKKETFALTPENDNKHILRGKRVRLEHHPEYWGVKYEGYLVCVKNGNGDIIMCKGKAKYEKNLHELMGARESDRFDEDMRKLDRGDRRWR